MDETQKALMDLGNVTPNEARQELRKDLRDFAQAFLLEPRREVVAQNTAVQDVSTQLPLQRTGGSSGSTAPAASPIDPVAGGTIQLYAVVNGGLVPINFNASFA